MSIFRNIVWYLKGLREYTKDGYLEASKKFNPADMDGINACGRSYLVTGANSGIGKVIASEIAKYGGRVHIVCRNEERGKAAVDEIKLKTKNENVYLHVVDFAKPVDVYRFAKGFSETEKVLDVLVNNAGCMDHKRVVDGLGFESNFSTNTLAVYMLTELLIPLFKKSQDARVITVSSGGMLTQKLDLSDLQSAKVNPFDATFVYAQQKRQQVIMTEQFAIKYPEIRFSSMHPGWADTPAVRDAMPSFYSKMKDKLRTPEQGADTAVWLAISPAAKDIENGHFFQDRCSVAKHLPLSWTSTSETTNEKLMSMLSEMLDSVGKASDGQGKD